MTGYEIHLNSEQINAAIEQGGMSLILTNRNIDGNDYISLFLGALNLDEATESVWIKEKEIREGDKIVIKIKTIQYPSTPQSIINLDKEKLQQERLDGFYKLKAELEQQGLL